MAGLFVAGRHTEGTATPGTVDGAWKGIFSITSPSNHRIRISSFKLMFPDAVAAALPLRLRVISSSDAFTPDSGNGGGAATKELIDLAASETIQSTIEQGATATNGNTAEPTTEVNLDVLYENAFLPNAGSFTWNGSLYLPGGTEAVWQIHQVSGQTDLAVPFHVVWEE